MKRSPLAPLHATAQGCEYDAIADRVARDKPGRVLDWGCGLGQMTERLTQRGLVVESFEYGGPDAPDELRPLQHFPEASAFVGSDTVRLPYASGHFDAVLSCGVLEHVHDPDRSLDELRRVLRPGGTLYVYKLPNRRSYLEWIARTIGLDYHGQGAHDVVYAPESARALLERHGYRIRDLRYANMLPLTLGRPRGRRTTALFWRTNGALSRVVLLKRLATNVEVIALAS